MTALELYREATRRGLALKPAGSDRLAVIPARLCPQDFASVLREHKPELLALLTGGTTTEPPEPVKPYRPLTEHERALLVRFCGNENDPIIITALNLFNGRIVE
jgi:hypothetical protein